MSESHRYQIAVELVTEECGGCGMTFAMPRELHRQAQEEGRSFRCPNADCKWPSQSYTETDVNRLKAQLEKEQARAEAAAKARRWAEENLEHERNSHRTTKGHLTRARRRAAAGVCPCCHRSFKQLRQHMAAKHPDYSPESEDTSD